MIARKEQERAALKQIRKIVDSLGEGSYVATAFKGCFEDAEKNIEADFAYISMKDRWESADKMRKKLTAKNAELLKRVEETEKTANSKVEALQNEVIRLKAKLYDMMQEA